MAPPREDMTMEKGTTNRTTRRQFLNAASSIAALTIIPRDVLGGPGNKPPSEKLNIACLGVGGRGYSMVMNVSTENIVALCDVDDKRGAKAFEQFPKAKRYHDFRRLLAKEAESLDAVVVATPDHVHIPASVMAMRMGKHVYCEKPLGHNIHEIRVAIDVARETGVATQMGTEAHSGYNYRYVAALIRAGTIGLVKEVHCWCDDDEDMPPDSGTLRWEDRQPQQEPPVPEHLHWDLWLGPAPDRPYHPCYHPVHWRGWWDFGNGRLGDMGCHLLDLAFSALDLKHPLTVETEGPPRVGRQVAPRWLISRWLFPPRGDLPQVELTWYHGNRRPLLQKKHNMPDYPEGVLFVGSKGMLIADYAHFELYPQKEFAGLRRPPLDPRSIHHQQEWIEACKTGRPTGCRFDYAGPLTETALLGTVAYRVGEKLHWDPVNLKATNCAKADRFIRRENRKGWEL